MQTRDENLSACIDVDGDRFLNGLRPCEEMPPDAILDVLSDAATHHWEEIFTHDMSREAFES